VQQTNGDTVSTFLLDSLVVGEKLSIRDDSGRLCQEIFGVIPVPQAKAEPFGLF
jgi:hypothetical protein